MQGAKMQGFTKAATVLDPSSSHFANTLQISASTSPAQILLISGESSINESRLEDRRKKSSWIRRLKSRDVAALSKGGSAEASLDTTYSEKGNSCERGSRIVQPGWFLQEKAANRVRAKPIWQGESVSGVKRQKTSELQDSDRVEKQRSDSCQEKASMVEPGKSTTLSAIALPSNSGFGPWVNFSRKPEMKPESILGSKVFAGTATTCSQESSKDSLGNFRSEFALTNSVPRCSPASMVGDVTAPAISLKSPLSPVHSKIGLPPRPPSQKSPGRKVAPSASGISRGGFHQFTRDVQLNRQGFETPSSGERKQSTGVQDRDTNEFAEAAVARCESFFHKPSPSEQSFSDPMRDHGQGSYVCGQQNNVPIRQARPSMAERASAYIAIEQPLGNYSNGAAVEFENNRIEVCEDPHLNVPREDTRGPSCSNLGSNGLDLHLKVSALGMEDPKSTLKNGSSSMEPNKTSMQSPSGSSYATSTCEKADASVSTSASLPWEMFIESAGTSRKAAREQFVEVYNRARDELKNQKMSQRTTRGWSKETDGGTKLTVGPGDTASDHKLRIQLLKHEQHLARHPQTQGRLSTNLEHRTLSVASNPKEQHLISHVESKGPVTTLANDQSGLIRDNGVSSKSDTQWKQADDFRIEQSLPEGQPRSNVKSVVQEGDQQDKVQFFSSTLAANTRGLASKPCEGNGSGQITRLSHQLDDRKESTCAVGKRSYVNFEEHSISRVAEKGVGSRVKPLSRPHVWLQRWHPTGVYNFKGLPDTQVLPSDGKRSDSASCFAFGLKKFKDGDGVGVFGRSRELKNVWAGKETGVENSKTSPSKMLPSAAAMAIVGTAARHFCSAQPQRKGSFSFWSGFGMPPPRKVEPVQEKEKAKMFLKADVDMPNC